MKATVTKAAGKSGPVKTGKAAATADKAPAKAKAVAGSALKSLTAKLGKAIQSALKPAAKKSAAVPVKAAKAAKSIAESTKVATKPAARVAAKPATVPAKPKAAAVKPVKSVSAASAKTPAKAPPKAVKKADNTGVRAVETIISRTNSKAVQSDAPMSANNAAEVFVDKIQKTVVSKVSEVATKTSKSPSDVPADGTLLTETQILKMGEKDYMSPAQLAFFKARLQQLEKDLLRNAGETTEHLRETVLVPDPADRATIEEEHALELRTRDRERKLLKKVQQSILSIDAGDYGWCEETGEPIGVPRLLARPTATLSLEAQQRRELKQKLYGD